MTTSNPRRANGHRRNQLRRRVLAEEDICGICLRPVEKSLGLMPGVHSRRCVKPGCTGCVPHPMSPEVDEIVPVSLGGDPLARANCRLAHRWHLQCATRQRDKATANPTSCRTRHDVSELVTPWGRDREGGHPRPPSA